MITNIYTNQTINDARYYINYKKKDGTRRIIKTKDNVNFDMPNHILVWDCENKGWRKLIKTSIIDVIEGMRAIEYNKLNNERRILIGYLWKETNTHIFIFDICCNGWRTLIKNRIMTDAFMYRNILNNS